MVITLLFYQAMLNIYTKLGPWYYYTKLNSICFIHGVNPRLNEDDRAQYDARVGVRDTRG